MGDVRYLKIMGLLAISLAAFNTAFAQKDDGFGVGVMVGEPSGFTFKKCLGRERALDGGIAWSLWPHESLNVYADYLFQYPFESEELTGYFPLYVGLGVRYLERVDSDGREHDEDYGVGVRIPLGVSYMSAVMPLDIFVEVAGIYDFIPYSALNIHAVAGMRYYF